MKRWWILPLVFVWMAFGIPGFTAESDDTLQQTAEIYLNTVAAKTIEEQCGKNGKLTLSAPMECYEMTAGYSLWKAYTGHSLSPGYGADEIRVFIVSCDGEPMMLMVLRRQESGIWMLDAFGQKADPVLDAAETLRQQTSDREEIAYLLIGKQLYPFTPNRYNGYLAVPHMPESRMVYSTRDILIDYYDKTKEWLANNPLYQKFGGSVALEYPIVPSRHYPVWPFWLAVIGIPAAVVALGVGTVILVRKRKHAK